MKPTSAPVERTSGTPFPRRRVAAAVALFAWGLAATFHSCGSPYQGQLSRPAERSASKKGCADCHADFVAELAGDEAHFEGMGQRCEDCHARHGLVGVLKLRTPEPELCVECHADFASYADSDHPHVKLGVCSDCHDPHRSGAELTAAGVDSCLSCHDGAEFREGNLHAPVAEGCAACHDPHGGEGVGGLVQQEPDLCWSCHDAAAPEFADAHWGYDVRSSSCGSCHEAHASESPGLMHALVHEPLDDCTTCHVEPEGDALAPPDTLAAANALCAVCHADAVGDFAERPSGHLPVEKGECLDCHVPHASEHAGLLARSVEETCAACHETRSELAELAENRFATRHPPAVEGRCLDCHDAHGGVEEPLLAVPEEDLCLSCHAEHEADFDAAFVHAPFGDACTNCHDGHGSRTTAILHAAPATLCLTCHTDMRERQRTEDLHHPVAQGQCLICHEPHGSDHVGVLRGPREELCFACHENLDPANHGQLGHAPSNKGQCYECHDAHSSPRASLLATPAEELCSRCHGSIELELEDARSVHAPVEAGACLTCHAPHHAEDEALLRGGDSETCGACHSDVFAETRKPGSFAHPPAIEGDCRACHLPHASSHPGLARADGAELCWTCHDPSAEAMGPAHVGLLEDTTDCLACHAPHASPGRGLIWHNRHEPFAQRSCDECHSETD